jgi:phenylacetate-CoA ligase
MDELTVQVEAASADSARAERDDMASRLSALIKDRVGVTARVEVLDPHSLERSLGKARRISDQRRQP